DSNAARGAGCSRGRAVQDRALVQRYRGTGAVSDRFVRVLAAGRKSCPAISARHRRAAGGRRSVHRRIAHHAGGPRVARGTLATLPRGADDVGRTTVVRAAGRRSRRRKLSSRGIVEPPHAAADRRRSARGVDRDDAALPQSATAARYQGPHQQDPACLGGAVVPNEVVQSRGRWLVAEAAVWSSVVVAVEVEGESGGAFA